MAMTANTTGRTDGTARAAATSWLFALAAGLAALLALRIAALWFNATDLFFDEAQYWHWSTEPAWGYYSKPPLVAWLIAVSTGACGLSEACIRLPAPILHTATAAAIAWLGWRLYDARVGALAGLAFATLPAVSLSAGIISTDVPLLLFWALALVGFSALLDTRAWWPALVLGLALGLGLLAKYAMAWFLLCAAIYLVVVPERRSVLSDRRLWSAFAVAAAMIAPNLAWNAANSFATFSHTADNAKWSGALVNPLKALEFFGAQFGVFGPVLFGGLLVIARRAMRLRLADADRLLLAFALPVLIAITIQAFVSRAHANWAAVSYVAGVVLVVAVMVREASWGWLRASFAVHLAALVLLVVGTAAAGRFALPGGTDPFARTLGWRAVAEATRAELARARAAGTPYGAVISDDRPVTAELLYYMRDEPTPILAWRGKGRPQDHFEMTRPFGASARDPVLLVAARNDTSPITQRFADATALGVRDLPAGGAKRRIALWRLTGYRVGEQGAAAGAARPSK